MAVTIPVNSLGNPDRIGVILIQDRTGATQPQFSVDDVQIINISTDPLPPLPSVTIYDDAVNASWYKFDYNSTLNFDVTAPVHSGAKAIQVDVTGAYGLLGFGTNTEIPAADYSAISFWVYGGSASGARQLQLFTNDSANVDSNRVPFDAPANTWTQITITAAQLGNPAKVKNILIQDRTGAFPSQFFVDDVQLILRSTSGNTRNGIWAAQLSPGGSAYRNLWQGPVNVTPNTTYTAGFWFKGSGTIDLRVMAGTWGAEIGTKNGCAASGGWTKCSVSFNSGANTQITYRLANPNTTSALYIDDAFLSAASGANALGNGDFESGATVWFVDIPFAIVQNP